MYDNRQLIYGSNADGPIERYTAVIYGATATTHARAAGPGPNVVGISANIAVAAGDRFDFVAEGPHKGRLGAVAVTRGTWLKPDGLGRLIAAVAGDWAIARAEQAGNGLDIIDITVQVVKI